MKRYWRILMIYLQRWRNSLVRFSDTPASKRLLFIHSLLDSIFLPLSIDFSFLPLVATKPSRAGEFANICLVASIIGGSIGYLIGMAFMNSIGIFLIQTFGFTSVWESILNTYTGNLSYWTLTIAAVTPLPYNMATLASGATEMNFVLFLLISIAGRAFRFYLLAYGIKYLGKHIGFFRRLKKSNQIKFETNFESAS
jgi:membrane protein YqaA with SNARE-associated domain